MSKEEAFSWPGGAKAAVSLTFDDARPSQVDNGLKILERHGVKATFYVNPGSLAQRLEGWKRAVAAGHEIGNHTVSHPCSGNFPWSRENALEDWTLERMEKELLEANRLVGGMLGVTPRTFGYPCGQTFVGRGEGTRSYVPLVAKHFLAGRAFMTEHQNNPGFCDLAQLGCVPLDLITADEAMGHVEKNAGAWIIFAGHEVAEKGYQVTQMAELDRLCGLLRERSSLILVDTVLRLASCIREKRGAG